MFKQILYTQWKWTGWLVVGAALAGFAVPVISVQATGASIEGRYEIAQLLGNIQGWGYAYPVLALLSATMVALASWSPDQLGRHVYALSLPLPRWHYVLLRFGAGAVLLAPVVMGVWIGGLVASVSIVMPPGLHAYPSAIALRFLLSALLMYAVIFALASGSRRSAGYLVGAVLSVFVLQALLSIAGSDVQIVEAIFERLLTWPGPFEVLAAQWMLINV